MNTEMYFIIFSHNNNNNNLISIVMYSHKATSNATWHFP